MMEKDDWVSLALSLENLRRKAEVETWRVTGTELGRDGRQDAR